jgi:DNA-binding MarR family transcriptional regulator
VAKPKQSKEYELYRRFSMTTVSYSELRKHFSLRQCDLYLRLTSNNPEELIDLKSISDDTKLTVPTIIQSLKKFKTLGLLNYEITQFVSLSPADTEASTESTEDSDSQDEEGLEDEEAVEETDEVEEETLVWA